MYDRYVDTQHAISDLDAEIRQLRAEYDAWEHDPFWYEAYARTQLHMGYPDETVYITQT